LQPELPTNPSRYSISFCAFAGAAALAELHMVAASASTKTRIVFFLAVIPIAASANTSTLLFL
jgi:hypothetical protein